MMVDDEVYKQVTPAKLRGILAQYEEPTEEGWKEVPRHDQKHTADLQQMKEGLSGKDGAVQPPVAWCAMAQAVCPPAAKTSGTPW